MSPVVLPDDVLNEQICSDCGQYLSVGDVVVSSTGDAICGRCLKPDISTPSLYNLVAKNYFFKCVNQDGCTEVHPFTTIGEHEKLCKRAVEIKCDMCYFIGNRCQFNYHMTKFHSEVKEMFGVMLSPQNMNIFVKSILNMDRSQLRTLLESAPRLFSSCVVCNKPFQETSPVYCCEKYHFACESCLNTCPKCTTFPMWDSKTFYMLLNCPWQFCYKQIDIFHYITHKRLCKFRQYKCPSRKCNYVGTWPELKKHWHLKPLVEGNNFFSSVPLVGHWFIPYVNEIISIIWYKRANDIIVVADLQNTVVSFFLNLNVLFSSNINYRELPSYYKWKYNALGHSKYMNITGQYTSCDTFRLNL